MVRLRRLRAGVGQQIMREQKDALTEHALLTAQVDDCGYLSLLGVDAVEYHYGAYQQREHAAHG